MTSPSSHDIRRNRMVSIVAPVFNSQSCLEELVQRLQSTLESLEREYEIILVNDSSSDMSWAVICNLTALNFKVKGINLRRNFGQDNAIMAGLRSTCGAYVVLMDDDLQHDPAYIPMLLHEIEKGFDVVYACYVCKKQKPWKNFGSRVNGWLARLIFHIDRSMYLSPFKIIQREVVREICRYSGAYPYVDGLLLRSTGNISKIMIEHKPRYADKSGYHLVNSLRIFFNHMTTFSLLPLRVAVVAGLGCSAAGIGLAVFFFLQRLTQPNLPAGWASIIICLLVLGGFQLFSLGIIGEYIGRAYLNINMNPQYIIKETIGYYEKSDLLAPSVVQTGLEGTV